jgi:hypothetical protein
VNERVKLQQKVSMSAINSINSSAPYTPPLVSVTPKAKAASPTSTPPAVPEPVKTPVAANQTATAAAVSATSYRNASGDTVSINNVVLKDRDGDGGVGLPAAKVAAHASSVQGKVTSAYSAN